MRPRKLIQPQCQPPLGVGCSLGLLLLLLQLLFLSSVHCFVSDDSPRGASRFFLDSANEKEWENLLCTGMFHGVTTNPLVLKQVNQPCTIENLHRMAHVALQSVNEFFCQTWGSTVEEMYQNGMALTQPARDRIVVKVPITLAGVQVATKLIQSGCRVCLTAVFDHKQVLTAVAIGAEYLAPCLGLMNDIGKDGEQECRQMLEIVKGLKGQTRVLVACVRDVDQLTQLAAAGMDTSSFSPEIAKNLFLEPLTDAVAAEFEHCATVHQSCSGSPPIVSVSSPITSVTNVETLSTSPPTASLISTQNNNNKFSKPNRRICTRRSHCRSSTPERHRRELTLSR